MENMLMSQLRMSWGSLGFGHEFKYTRLITDIQKQ